VYLDMKQMLQVFERWLRTLGFKMAARVRCCSFSFSKYRIDAQRPARYIERRLRRKLRRNFRVAVN
jgi:hypothetical protein